MVGVHIFSGQVWRGEGWCRLDKAGVRHDALGEEAALGRRARVGQDLGLGHEVGNLSISGAGKTGR